MTDKQERLYLLFKEIDTICKKHGLRYFMAGGSLIGVVRHRGYIPWDDDMDILMPRDDFNKFVEICKTEAPANRVVESPELDRKYHNNLGRYVDTSVTTIHKNQIVHDDPAGFVIDILILDPIPDDKKIMEQYKKDIMLYSDLINGSLVYSFRFNFNAWRFMYYYFKMKLFGKDKVFKELEDRMFCYNEEDCTKYVMRWGGCCFFFDKDMYGQGKFEKFLDIEVMIPEKTVEYLTWHYGDEWSYIPPHGEQEGHDAIFSLDADYESVRKLIYSFINPKKVNNFYYRRKLLLLAMMKKRNLRKERRKKFQLTLQTENILKYLYAHKEEINSAYENRDISQLNEYLGSYISLQLDRETIGREDYPGIYRFTFPILLDVPSEYTDMALEVLFCTERISKAARVIEVIKELKGEVTEKQQQIYDDIMAFRKAVIHYSKREFDQAVEICERLIKVYPESISLIKLAIRLLLKKNDTGSYNEQIRGIVSKGMTLSPADGEWLKYQADTMEDSMSKIEMYLTAVSFTSNGIAHLEITDYINNHKAEVLDYLQYVVKTEKDNANQLVENYLFLFEDDEIALVLNNVLLEKANGIMEAEKAFSKLAVNSQSPVITSRYQYLVQKMSQNEFVSDIMLEGYKFAFDTAKLEALITKIKASDVSNDWKSVLIAKCYEYLGNSKAATANYLNAVENTDNQYVIEYAKSFFVNDIKMLTSQLAFCSNLSVSVPTTAKLLRQTEKYKSQTEDIIENNTKEVISQFANRYPDYISTLELFKKINLLNEKQINFILATLKEDNKNNWDIFSAQTLNLMLEINSMEKDDSVPQVQIDKLYQYIDKINKLDDNSSFKLLGTNFSSNDDKEDETDE